MTFELKWKSGMFKSAFFKEKKFSIKQDRSSYFFSSPPNRSFLWLSTSITSCAQNIHDKSVFFALNCSGHIACRRVSILNTETVESVCFFWASRLSFKTMHWKMLATAAFAAFFMVYMQLVHKVLYFFPCFCSFPNDFSVTITTSVHFQNPDHFSMQCFLRSLYILKLEYSTAAKKR